MRRSKFRPTVSTSAARRSTTASKSNTSGKTSKDDNIPSKGDNKSPKKDTSVTSSKIGKENPTEADSDITQTVSKTPTVTTTEPSTATDVGPSSPSSKSVPTVKASPTPAATNRRRRAAAVPNLGRPRIRPSVPSQKNKEIATKESVSDDSSTLRDPPTVTRVTDNRPSKLTDKQNRSDQTCGKGLEKISIPSSGSGAVGTSKPPPTPTRDRFADKRTVTPNIHDRRMRDLKDIEKEQETPAKRRKRYVKTQPPDRSKMTMSDLIYYNPKNNPMKSSFEDREKKSGLNGDEDEQVIGTIDSIQNDETPIDDPPPNAVNEENEEDKDENEDEDSAMPVPQVRISDDGTIVINEASLVVEASPTKSQEPLDSEVVYEKSSYTTSASFRKRTHTATWTERENAKFYRALSTVGTDFSLINAMFPKRTRNEIKNKFKREERINRVLIDKAITERQHFDMSVFDQTESDIEAENEKTRKKKAKENKKERGKRKAVKSKKTENTTDVSDTRDTSVMDTTEHDQTTNSDTQNMERERDASNVNDETISNGQDSDYDGMEYEDNDSVNKPDADVDSEDDIQIIDILSKPTRSGRQPKPTKSFTIEEPKQKRQRKPRNENKMAADKQTLPTLKSASKESHEFSGYSAISHVKSRHIQESVKQPAQQNDSSVPIENVTEITGMSGSRTNISTQDSSEIVQQGGTVISSLSSFGNYIHNSPVNVTRTTTSNLSESTTGITTSNPLVSFTYIFPDARFKTPSDTSGTPSQGEQQQQSEFFQSSNVDTNCASLDQSNNTPEIQYIDNQLDVREEQQMIELLDAEAVVTTSSADLDISTCSNDVGPFIPPTVIATTKVFTNVINNNMSDSDSND